MLDIEKLEVTAKTQVFKYAEGDDPETSEPFEVVEHEETLKGEVALNYLKMMGVDVNAINNSR